MKRNIQKNLLGFTLIELLVVIAIIAILIGLLLPAVQKNLQHSAQNAQQFPKLQLVAASVLQTSDSLQGNLEAAQQYFLPFIEGSNEGPPNAKTIGGILDGLEQNEADLRAELAALPNLGPANDKNYRQAYLDLRKALVDASTDLHQITVHLRFLLHIMNHLE